MRRLWRLLTWPGIRTGICHCGAGMDDHTGWDNHSPVEMLDWRYETEWINA